MMWLGAFLAGTLAVLAGLIVDISTASPSDHGRSDYECPNPDVCQNGGTCWFQISDITLCACPEEYDDGLHCEYYNHCFSDPCMNGGICDNDYTDTISDDYYCVCKDGYTGRNCEQTASETSCTGLVCEHDGTCYHYFQLFFCVCQGRYYGYLCEAIDDPTCIAVTAPCANGGSCIDDENGRGYCHCTDEWAGDNCTEPFTMASLCDKFCENAGSCYITVEHEPACRCTPGWTGEQCSEPLLSPSAMPDICYTVWDPCGDNGRCIPDIDSYLGFVCRCTTGWQGEFCQEYTGHVVTTTTTQASTICDTSLHRCGDNGRCEAKAYGGYSCRCFRGWVGDYCRDRENETPSMSLPIGGIVGASVGGLVLFVVIFAACFILSIAKASRARRSRNPRSEPTPMPSIIYDPGVHADFDGSVHGPDRYEQPRIPRRYTPAPIRDQRGPKPSNMVRNPGARTYDYAYEPGPKSKARRMASPSPRAPAPMSMPGVEQGHEYAYAIDNAAYEPSPRNPVYAPSPRSTTPSVMGPPPPYSRTPSRAPSSARSEHTYQSISEYADPPSSPTSQAQPAPSVKSVGSHPSSKE